MRFEYRRLLIVSLLTVCTILPFQNCTPEPRFKGLESGSVIQTSQFPMLYGAKIVVAQPLAKNLQPAIDDLQKYLKEMDGADYRLSQDRSGPGILLTLTTSSDAPADLVTQLQGKGIQAFVIRGNSSQLQIVANEVDGLSYGVYFYLEQLGARWLLPGENWTIIPQRTDITLNIDRMVIPSYNVRSYAGTGGFFSSRWGSKYAGSIPFMAQITAWQRRLRYGGEHSLGHAMGEAFVMEHANPYPDPDPVHPKDHTLQLHPEYLAKVDGQYSPLYIPHANGQYIWDPVSLRYIKAVPIGTGTHTLNIVAKVNAGNPAAVAAFVQWILAKFRQVRAVSSNASQKSVISVEPADGYGYGNNYSELPGNGSASDQTFYIANQCAKAVRAEFPGTSVILLAYAGHADPPSFPLESNVMVQITPYAFRGGPLTAKQFIDQWKTRTATLDVYDYWSIPDWTHDRPVFNYLEKPAHELRGLHANNVEGINFESTFSAGAMGLGHYVASHLMWDLNLDEHALIEDFYDKAFGPAKAPMKRMLERWARSFKLLSVELGSSFADVDEAMNLAAGNAAVLARIDDYARYVQFLRLNLEIENAPNQTEKRPKVNNLLDFILDINESRMVHTTRIFDLYIKAFPDLAADFDLSDPAHPGPGWARVRPLSHAEVAALVADGKRTYAPPDFIFKAYSGELVPLQPLTWTPPTGDPWGTIMPTVSDLDVNVQMPSELAHIPLRVSRFADNRIEVSNSMGTVIFDHNVRGLGLAGRNIWEQLDIPIPHPGRYKIHFHPTGGRASGYFSFQTWRGVPLNLSSFLLPKGVGSPRLYFYVPLHLSKIAIYFPETLRAGGFDALVFQPSGAPASIESRDNGRLMIIAVPSGQDGQVWSMNRIVQPDFPIEMLNVPQSFAFSPETLLIPADSL